MSIIEKIVEKAENKNKGESLQKKVKTDSLTARSNSNFNSYSEKKISDSKTILKSNTTEKFENKVKAKGIFSLNRKKMAKAGYLCSEDANNQISEEYRVIKRPLVNNAIEEQENGINRKNLILVTSSQPGEGKTFTAINLALSIASEKDKKVLLVDADVAKPSINTVLGISDKVSGLTDYLNGDEEDVSNILINTDILGLTVIPAGKKNNYSTELLASKKMALLADELHSRYADRIVIFDSPPLLAATQAEVLAGHVGQVVLVIESEQTPQSMVLESIEKLKVCDVVLALLNKVTSSFDLNKYGYGQYGQ